MAVRAAAFTAFSKSGAAGSTCVSRMYRLPAGAASAWPIGFSRLGSIGVCGTDRASSTAGNAKSGMRLMVRPLLSFLDLLQLCHDQLQVFPHLALGRRGAQQVGGVEGGHQR